MLDNREFLFNAEQRLKKMKEAKSKVVVVGVIDGKYDDGTSVAEVAIRHEYGGNGVPQRSFLRNSVIEKEERIDDVINSEFSHALDNNDYSIDKALGRVGLEVVNIVKFSFRENGYGTWKPLKTDYFNEKMKRDRNLTLIDSGKLRDSIKSEVRNG